MKSKPEDKRAGRAKKAVGKRGQRTVKPSSKGSGLVAAAQAAAALMNDSLVVAVHAAGKAERALIARLLGV